MVFLPAWNEEANLPAVLDELRSELPDVDLLVVDDGSTDRTAEVAREHGARVHSFPHNRGLRAADRGRVRASPQREGYAYCGRVDADGQHPAAELRRLLERVQVPGRATWPSARGSSRETATSRTATARARPPLRHSAPAALDGASGSGSRSRTRRAACTRRTRRRFRTSPSPTRSGAPEVEGLIRLAEAGLVVEEVPVNMRERASGESKLTGKTALKLVLTVAATLLLYRRFKGRA